MYVCMYCKHFFTKTCLSLHITRFSVNVIRCALPNHQKLENINLFECELLFGYAVILISHQRKILGKFFEKLIQPL